MSKAKEFVGAHSHDHIPLVRVLHHVHASRFYFCKIFKKTTGITFTEYVARVRVEKAKALLLDSSLRVSEVVFAAGFGSIPQFNSVFKRFVGKSPTEYRSSPGQSPHDMESRMTNRANPSARKRALPDNVILPASFQPEEDSSCLPTNVILPGLGHPNRRIARA